MSTSKFRIINGGRNRRRTKMKIIAIGVLLYFALATAFVLWLMNRGD
jgi:hypothetical protein